jgi:hypothetical protein
VDVNKTLSCTQVSEMKDIKYSHAPKQGQRTAQTNVKLQAHKYNPEIGRLA